MDVLDVLDVFGVVVVDDADELLDEDDEDALARVPITIVTVDPFARCEPPGGDWVRTRPTFDASVTGRVFTWAWRPAAWIACSACAVVSPVIDGTLAFAGA